MGSFSSLRNRVGPAVDEEPLVTVTEYHTECSALCIQLLNLLDLAYETAGHSVDSHMACIPAVSLELHPGPHLPWTALGSSLWQILPVLGLGHRLSDTVCDWLLFRAESSDLASVLVTYPGGPQTPRPIWTVPLKSLQGSGGNCSWNLLFKSSSLKPIG